jgi:hypothetical protein
MDPSPLGPTSHVSSCSLDEETVAVCGTNYYDPVEKKEIIL